MSENYRRVMGYFYGQPWALERAKYEEIEGILLARSSGERLGDDEIRARIGHGEREAVRLWDIETSAFLVAGPDQAYRAADGTAAERGRPVVAVVGVYGVLTHRAGMFTQTSGLTSAEGVGARVRAAASDPAVKGIVLDVDSPGGSVYGIQEAGDEIRAARAAKPVKAVANARAASAAYWMLSQADEAFATPSGEVGSIGVILEHYDVTAMNEKLGVKVTTITHGKNKALGSPNAPLTEDARAELERRVREYGNAFEHAVAKGRSVPVETVRKEFGQGLMFGAKEAAERGMIDGVATLDEVIRQVGRARPAAPAPAAAVAPDERLAAMERLRLL